MGGKNKAKKKRANVPLEGQGHIRKKGLVEEGEET